MEVSDQTPVDHVLLAMDEVIEAAGLMALAINKLSKAVIDLNAAATGGHN